MAVLDEEEKKRLKAENDSFEAGDPRIVWELGCQSFHLSFLSSFRHCIQA